MDCVLKSVHEVSKFLSERIHNPKCDKCKKEEDRLKWENLSEPEDYVTCLECGYRAENLTSHIINTHPDYNSKFPNSIINSLKLKNNCKNLHLGSKHSEETKKKMSDNAGKWNEGLTKETDSRVAALSEKLLWRTSWNTGLTCESNEILAGAVEKLKRITSDNGRYWSNGLKANLTLEDFKPFMDSEGRVDHFSVIEKTGLNWVTVHKYILELSLDKTKKYIEQRAENRLIRIDKEILLRYVLKNNKVSIGKVIANLGYSFKVVKRECKRHGLKTFTRNIRQSLCIHLVSKILNDLFYIQEWRTRKCVNPISGHRFRFDGYFPEIGLIVEFHVHQHYVYPNIYHKTEEEYLEQRERDRVKEEMIKTNPDLKFFKILEDEPFDNIDYLTGRLVSEGILKVL